MKAKFDVFVERCDVGLGLFAARSFRKGECMIVFEGPLVEGHEGRLLSDAIQIGPEVYIDPVPPGKYVNHSCNPNAGLVNNVYLHALRDIPEGAEIRFDYSTSMGESFWTLECACNSPVCRGLVADFVQLPPELRAKYLELGIVQDFIKQGLSRIPRKLSA